jgi:hypothetical protein
MLVDLSSSASPLGMGMRHKREDQHKRPDEEAPE